MYEKLIDYEVVKLGDENTYVWYVKEIKNFEKVEEIFYKKYTKDTHDIYLDNEFTYVEKLEDGIEVSLSPLNKKELLNNQYQICSEKKMSYVIEMLEYINGAYNNEIMNFYEKIKLYVNKEEKCNDKSNSEEEYSLSYDIIENPSHYFLNIKGNEIEVIDIIDEIVKDYTPKQAFKVANILKYILRASKKNGLEDFKKAKKYIEMLLEME